MSNQCQSCERSFNTSRGLKVHWRKKCGKEDYNIELPSPSHPPNEHENVKDLIDSKITELKQFLSNQMDHLLDSKLENRDKITKLLQDELQTLKLINQSKEDEIKYLKSELLSKR